MDTSEAFTIALPDVPEMEAVGRRVIPAADLRVDHPSGRPWLLARTSATPTLVHDCGTTQIALIGPTSATEGDLARIATTRIRDLRDIPEQTRRFEGNFLVLASTPEGLFGHGSIAQTRRLYHAGIGGSTVLSDRADLLAALGEFPLDRTALAFRLIVAAPHPTSDLTLWSGVNTVAGSDYIVSPARSAPTTGTWWRRPSPELTRAEGAPLLREALARAVAVRTPAGIDVASDLSGGLDSTPICFFAAQGPQGVLARTFYGDDPGGREDLEWAMRAMVSMPGVHTHDTFTLYGVPDFYGGLDEMLIPLDEPSQIALAVPRIEHMLRKDAEAGITIHLHGAGGDHLLRGLPMWNHTIARKRPVLAWTRSRADDVTTDTPWVGTLRHLLDRSMPTMS